MLKQHKKGSGIMFGLSVIASIIAGIVFIAGLPQVIGLAGTQWILVAIILAVYANYLGTCCSDSSCCSSEGGEKGSSAE